MVDGLLLVPYISPFIVLQSGKKIPLFITFPSRGLLLEESAGTGMINDSI